MNHRSILAHYIHFAALPSGNARHANSIARRIAFPCYICVLHRASEYIASCIYVKRRDHAPVLLFILTSMDFNIALGTGCFYDSVRVRRKEALMLMGIAILE